MAVSLAISQICSVKQWPDLEIWLGSFKVIENNQSVNQKRIKVTKVTNVTAKPLCTTMVPFDRPRASFYWSAIVTIALSCTIFELFGVE